MNDERVKGVIDIRVLEVSVKGRIRPTWQSEEFRFQTHLVALQTSMVRWGAAHFQLDRRTRAWGGSTELMMVKR